MSKTPTLVQGPDELLLPHDAADHYVLQWWKAFKLYHAAMRGLDRTVEIALDVNSNEFVVLSQEQE